jgi:hypothetical protein
MMKMVNFHRVDIVAGKGEKRQAKPGRKKLAQMAMARPRSGIPKAQPKLNSESETQYKTRRL